ncbi:hypothetical protein CC78DRAFT_539293 [Lojkania enalia]|uniref:Uncharacterized protein n=1 Tax=Lojkania enalia TaxID=147567 RepID=A0A9P4TPE9_9PLEO|nr:hypothetical protein CC78DRAFT_539293 [Didymosphaeria enalia]
MLAATCHSTIPCLLPFTPFSLAKSPSPLNYPSTSFNKFSAAVLLQAVPKDVLGIEGKVPPKAAGKTSRFGGKFPGNLSCSPIAIKGLSRPPSKDAHTKRMLQYYGSYESSIFPINNGSIYLRRLIWHRPMSVLSPPLESPAPEV